MHRGTSMVISTVTSGPPQEQFFQLSLQRPVYRLQGCPTNRIHPSLSARCAPRWGRRRQQREVYSSVTVFWQPGLLLASLSVGGNIQLRSSSVRSKPNSPSTIQWRLWFTRGTESKGMHRGMDSVLTRRGRRKWRSSVDRNSKIGYGGQELGSPPTPDAARGVAFKRREWLTCS